MGMFDSLIDVDGKAWQTKVLDCCLFVYHVGDAVPSPLPTCQIEILGLDDDGNGMDAYATIRDGKLAAAPDARDEKLALVDYGEYVVTPASGSTSGPEDGR